MSKPTLKELPMIIREIKKDPKALKHFDWFNDYKDTKSWAKRNCPNMVKKLDQGWEEYKRRVSDGSNN